MTTQSLNTPQFQLIVPGVTPFGAWADGTWDAYAPPTGPYAARITVGPVEPVAVNPGVAGTYIAYGRFDQTTDETPVFPIGTVILSAP